MMNLMTRCYLGAHQTLLQPLPSTYPLSPSSPRAPSGCFPTSLHAPPLPGATPLSTEMSLPTTHLFTSPGPALLTLTECRCWRLPWPWSLPSLLGQDP